MFYLFCLSLIIHTFLLPVICQKPCTFIAEDGSTYDLTRLASLGTISGTDSDALWTYAISICANAVTCGTTTETGYCQYGNIGGREFYNNVGYLDQVLPKKNGEGVELVYFAPQEQRAGKVIITCNPNALIADITAITPPPENPLGFEFRFSSIAGCSTVTPCSVETGSHVYDLSDFIGVSSITALDDMGEWQYTVSICADKIPNCDVCSKSGYCQTSKQSPDYTYCVGTFKNISGNADGTGVVLYYDEPLRGRKGQVHITCDPQAGLVSDITAISPPELTGYAFYFKSYAACPTPPDSLCKVTSPDGKNYKLDALMLHEPISGEDLTNYWKYTVSVCQNSLSCADIEPAGYCQYRIGSEDFQFCVGAFKSIEGLNDGKGVVLTYEEPIEGRIGKLTINCNPGGDLVSNISVFSPPEEKTDYRFSFDSSAACPQ